MLNIILMLIGVIMISGITAIFWNNEGNLDHDYEVDFIKMDK